MCGGQVIAPLPANQPFSYFLTLTDRRQASVSSLGSLGGGKLAGPVANSSTAATMAAGGFPRHRSCRCRLGPTMRGMNAAIRCTGLVKTYAGRPPVEAVRGLDLTVETGECFGLPRSQRGRQNHHHRDYRGTAPSRPPARSKSSACTGGATTRPSASASASRSRKRACPKSCWCAKPSRSFAAFYRRGLEPDEVIRRVSLEEKATARVGKLSGGQRQRLAVACALVGDPELLLLDEPTTGLDPQSRRQLWDLIRGFRAQGRTVLLTTHYMDEAERLCDRVAVVDHGKVIAQGSPRELIAESGRRTRRRVHARRGAGDTRRSRRSLADTARRALGPARTPSTSVCRSQNRTSPCRLCWSWLRQRGHDLASLNTRHASLEDVFVTLTGRHLRDGEATP